MQGSAAEIHVVVSFLARGQRHLAVDDGQFLDQFSEAGLLLGVQVLGVRVLGVGGVRIHSHLLLVVVRGRRPAASIGL